MDGTASPNIHTIVKAQIVFLLSTLTEDNFERNQVEIRSVRICESCALGSLQLTFPRLLDLRACSCPSSMALTRTSTSSAASSFTPTADSHLPRLLLHSTNPPLSHSVYSCKRLNVSHATPSLPTGFEMASIVARETFSATSTSSSLPIELGFGRWRG